MCFARCQRVREELQTLGIEPERIRLSQAEGNEPLAANLTPEELKLNSRVDVILLPDLADIPWERRKAEEELIETTMEPLAAEGVAHAESHAIDEAVTEVHQPPAAADAHAATTEHEASQAGGPHGEPASLEHGVSHDEPAAHAETDAHAEANSHGAAASHGDSPAHHEHAGGHDDHGAEHPPVEVHVPPPH
jgi:hypothetical protein